MCVCVCVYVFVRETDRDTEGRAEGKREKKRESENVQRRTKRKLVGEVCLTYIIKMGERKAGNKVMKSWDKEMLCDWRESGV